MDPWFSKLLKISEVAFSNHWLVLSWKPAVLWCFRCTWNWQFSDSDCFPKRQNRQFFDSEIFKEPEQSVTERIKYPHNACYFLGIHMILLHKVSCTVDLDDSRIDSSKLDHHMRICCVWICSKHKKFGILVTLSAAPFAERWDSKASFWCKHSIMFVREDGAAFFYWRNSKLKLRSKLNWFWRFLIARSEEKN